MPYRTDDITPFLGPSGQDGGGLLFAEGKLIAFNPVTLENEVAFRGTVARNLRVVAAAVDAKFWQPGELLTLNGYAPRGGSSVWWITGRTLQPGPGAAAQLVAALSGINAENITSVTTLGTEILGLSSSGFEELPGGPALSVEIGATGKVIVHLSASIIGTSTAAFPDVAQNGGRMGVALSGANTIAASADKSVAVLHQVSSRETDTPFQGNITTMQTGGRLGTTVEFSGLNPGLTTFTAMYDRLFPFEVGFTDRTIVVVRS